MICIKKLFIATQALKQNAYHGRIHDPIRCTSVAPYPEYDTVYLSLSLLEIETEGDFSSSHDIYGYYTQYDFILLLVTVVLVC